jgi:hypothetical protein
MKKNNGHPIAEIKKCVSLHSQIKLFGYSAGCKTPLLKKKDKVSF